MKGLINQIYQKNGKYNLYLMGEEKYFSGLGECPFAKGVEVDIEFKVEEVGGKTYQNIIKIVKVLDLPLNNERKCKNRISALQVAVQMEANRTSLEMVIKDAEDIENWINR